NVAEGGACPAAVPVQLRDSVPAAYVPCDQDVQVAIIVVVAPRHRAPIDGRQSGPDVREADRGYAGHGIRSPLLRGTADGLGHSGICHGWRGDRAEGKADEKQAASKTTRMHGTLRGPRRGHGTSVSLELPEAPMASLCPEQARFQSHDVRA